MGKLIINPQPPESLQALPAQAAALCLGVERFLKKDLGLDPRGQKLLVAFSGGADSSALLLIMRYLSQRCGFELFAAHLNHGLRPGAAAEAAWCSAFCRAVRVPFLCAEKNVAALAREKGLGTEEAARTARYAFLGEAAKNNGCAWIATGHQNDDLAEDLIMRLIRGAGWPALSGMPALDAGRGLLRPLLLTPRAKIEQFLTILGMHWLSDESNQDRKYLRNRVRLDILPLLIKENPSFLENAAGIWRLGRLDGEYFTALVEDIENRAGSGGEAARPAGKHFLPAGLLAPLPKALRLRLYKRSLDGLGQGQALLKNLLALDDSWLAAQNSGQGGLCQFPGKKTALVRKKGILFGFAKQP